MKKILKNIGCFTLAIAMLTTNIQYVYAYTTDDLMVIKKSDEATVLYILKNKDLELYVSESDAEKNNTSQVTYKSSEEYANAGTQEGRRAGITQSIDDYNINTQPSESKAKKALDKISDTEILKQNKISSTDANKDLFLENYKVGYLDAYNIAQYQLAGYYFGQYRGKADLVVYFEYTTKPSVATAYGNASSSVFSAYGVSANDTYAKTFEEAFKTGYEYAYQGEKENSQVAFEIGKIAGLAAAERVQNTLKSGEEFEGAMNYYISSAEYRTERSYLLSDFASYENYSELVAQYDAGFTQGVSEFSGGSSYSTSGDSLLDSGTAAGQTSGQMVGEAYAKNDYAKNLNFDEERAYSDYMSTTDLNNKYKLYLMPAQYVEGFKTGFEEGFKSGYTNVYLTYKSDTVNASKFIQLPSEGDLVAEHTVVADSQSLDVTMTLDFGFGNFFDESFVSVYDTGRSYMHDKTRYTAYSNIYEVDVYSNVGGVKQDYIKLKEPMTISFTHDLGENVGVYKLVGNQLRYMHTEVNQELSEETGALNVYATVPAGKYYGGTYVLLADEQVKKVRDIQNNWNYSGLDTYNRRGWLPVKNELATPESNITRAQLAFMLERNLNKENIIVKQPVSYNDQNKFYGYDNAINYCVTYGYMTVDGNNNFRPMDPVSYAELETILTRALGYKVSFATYDTKMKNELFHKSNYSVSPKKYITKSETVYTLLSIFQ